MKCRNCGILLREDSSFCHACGASVEGTDTGNENTAESMLHRAEILRQKGGLDEELSIYDEVVRQFAVSSPVDAATALLRKATRLRQIGVRERAESIYTDIEKRFSGLKDLNVVNIVKQAVEQKELMAIENKNATVQREERIKHSKTVGFWARYFYIFIWSWAILGIIMSISYGTWAGAVVSLTLIVLGLLPWYFHRKRRNINMNQQQTSLLSKDD